jgi:hypothetical protein
VNSIILTFCLFVTLFMFDLSFLLLLVYLEFYSESSRNCKDISCEHSQFCSKFFCHLHFEILQVVSWYHFRYGITGYLPEFSVPCSLKMCRFKLGLVYSFQFCPFCRTSVGYNFDHFYPNTFILWKLIFETIHG